MVYRGGVAGLEDTAHAREQADRRLEFETLLADFSSRFINLAPELVDGAIQDALHRVCELLEIDRAVLWQWSAATPTEITSTHWYQGQDVLRRPELLRQEHYPWFVQQMLAGNIVIAASPDELPVEASVDRETARRRGLKSNVTLPLSAGGVPVGALALTMTQAERTWPEALVKRLQLIADVFANALERKRADEAYRKSEGRLALAADAAEAGLWILDYRSGAVWATARARAIFGLSVDEVVTLEALQAAIHPDDRHLIRELMERSARPGELNSAECRVMTSEGGVRWILSRGRAQPTSTGEPGQMMGVSFDISERKEEQEALLAGQARLRAAAELAGLAYYEFDFAEDAAYFDDRYRDIVGIPRDGERGLDAIGYWMEHLHPDDRSRVLDLRRRLHEGSLEQIVTEYRYLHPRRGETWVQHMARVAARDANGRTLKSDGVLRDISALKESEAELRELGLRLITAQEEERARLARELHDDMSQRLAVVTIGIGRAASATAEDERAEAFQTATRELLRLGEDMHSLAYQLHPSILEELGLAEALRAECERRTRQGQIDISMAFEPLPARVAPEAALCLFRVAQEALNNAARHAETDAVSITLRQTDDGLLLAVSDDGVGFDPESPRTGMHLGLASMRERLQLVSGTLTIESAPNEGTTIGAWVPLHEESE